MIYSEQTPLYTDLTPTVLCDFDTTSEIKETALRAASNGADPRQITERIRDFVRQMPYRYDDWDVKASFTLKQGWGMCSGKANLLVAMLRSLQIPARYVIARCHAELELYHWLVKQNQELARIMGEPYREIDHVNAEVYLDNRWQVIDAARDPDLVAGLVFLRIPVEMRVIDQFSLSSFDDWAISRQKGVRLKSVRPAMLKLMNEQLDRIRSAPVWPEAGEAV
jgi:transglutaminase-like putative cysteine protease